MALSLPKSLIPARSQKASDGAGQARAVVPPNKANRFVLVLGDDGAILVFIQGGKVVRRVFAPTAEREHLATFIELMDANPKVPIYLLVDMIDQSYVRHTLPPVSPLGVKKLINRRLERDFAPEDIKGSLSLGRETAGRKEWNFLLISLANSAPLQQWLDVLLELPNRFMGIYLLPVEAQAMIGDLAAAVSGSSSPDQRATWQILVAHDKVSGFRQVVLKDGKLIFTRLTQSVGDSSPDVIAGNIEQEVLNTIEYLRRLSYSEQAGLEVYVVLAQEVKERIDVMKLRATRVNIFTPFEVSQLLNLPQAALSSDRYGDVVIGCSFGLRPKQTMRLMSVYGKKLEMVYHAKLGVRGAVALIGLLVLGSTLSDASSYLTVSRDIEQMTTEKQRLATDLADAKEQLDSLGDDKTAFINTALLYTVSDSAKVDPLAFIRLLAPQLGEGVLVRSLSWKVDAASTSATPATGQPAADAPEQTPFTVDVEVELLDHDDDRKKLKEQALALVDRLKEGFASFEVEPDKIPGAVKEQDQLVLNFDDPSASDSTLQEGENVMKITLKGPKAKADPDPNAATPAVGAM